jgi:hypothetical protein
MRIMPDEKKVFIFIAVFIFAFIAGFFSRSVFDGSRISNADEYHQTVESELGTADGTRIGIESGIAGARGGIERSLELSGIIGSGLEGIDRLAVENTELLGEAERILQDAGKRKPETADR